MTEQTKRMRRQFCSLYAMLGNVSEAALRAGFDPDTAFQSGLEILGMPAYQRLVHRLTSPTCTRSSRCMWDWSGLLSAPQTTH